MSNHHLFMKSAFPRAPLANGIGRFVPQLQRVTLKFCKNHGDSRGMRDFLENDLIDFAKSNPSVVVYAKPRRHRCPVIVAEYLNGSRHWIGCRRFTREEVLKHMELVRTQASEGGALRLRKLWHTEFPSIQGPWTPWTHANPVTNVSEFPNRELGKMIQTSPTATEELIRIFKEQKIAEESEEVVKQKVN